MSKTYRHRILGSCYEVLCYEEDKKGACKENGRELEENKKHNGMKNEVDDFLFDIKKYLNEKNFCYFIGYH